MPIYEYECEACTHRFDTLQKFSDAVLTKCPECEKESLRKLVSAAAFRLKGQGWYETDFKSGNKKNIAGASDSSASGSGEKSGQPNSETKGKSGDKPDGKKSSDSNKSSQSSSSSKSKASQG